jgi:hypothetical protein
MHDRARLPGSSTGEDEKRPLGVLHSCALLGVEAAEMS